MTKQELIKALDSGLDVRWLNDSYECFKDVTGIYSVICTSNDSMTGIGPLHQENVDIDYIGRIFQILRNPKIGIFSKDMQRSNIGLNDCYIKEEQSK